jgi:deoxyribodipyrimidine photo-lyase
VQLLWHRRDLRAADNAALAEAASAGTVCPVFVFDEAVLDHAAPPRISFMLDALASLRETYRDRGSDLVVARGRPEEALPEIAERRGADRVVFGEAYSGLGRRREDAVTEALSAVDVDAEAVTDAVHHRPGTITTNDGDPYAVFTYYWKKWRDREKADPHPAPDPADLADAEGDPLPTLDDLGFDEPEADVPAAGTEVARDLLTDFCDDAVYRYEDRRDYPADGATSRLSAHLKYGTIGVREVYAETEAAMAAAEGDEEREAVEEFQSQLAWREFYTQVLRYNPEVVTENYKEYEREIEWRDDPEALQAWKDGETGYPIVDAGMRQLRAEAWMHNRVRMIVAAFLTKDLLIDWREGYDWFREKLVDHDTANDNGGWQWAASTGTDAQPYFRIFNPMTQGERYDPDAEYIKQYVPELRDADPKIIHGWHEASLTQRRSSAPEYPDPIVDHAERREEAIAMFERARGE